MKVRKNTGENRGDYESNSCGGKAQTQYSRIHEGWGHGMIPNCDDGVAELVVYVQSCYCFVSLLSHWIR